MNTHQADSVRSALALTTSPIEHQPSALDELPISEVLALLPEVPGWPDPAASWKGPTYLRGATRILLWLSQFDKPGWQARWDAADGNDLEWFDPLAENGESRLRTRREELTGGLRFLILARAMRPSYEFFHRYHVNKFYDSAQRALDPTMFVRLDRLGAELGISGKNVNDAKKTIVKIMLHTGLGVDQLTEQHLLEFRNYYLDRGLPRPPGIPPGWELLATPVCSRQLARCTTSSSVGANDRPRKWLTLITFGAERFGTCLCVTSTSGDRAPTTAPSST